METELLVNRRLRNRKNVTETRYTSEFEKRACLSVGFWPGNERSRSAGKSIRRSQESNVEEVNNETREDEGKMNKKPKHDDRAVHVVE